MEHVNVDLLLAKSRVEIVPFTARQAEIARKAFRAALTCARSREGLAGVQLKVENCARHHIPLPRFVFKR